MAFPRVSRKVSIPGIITSVLLASLGLSSTSVPTSAGTTSALTWTVPAGVEIVQLTLTGARGGDGVSSEGNRGGSGGRVVSSFLVQPGDVFRIGLGTPGSSAAAGGAGGANGLSTGFGGNGGLMGSAESGGGGGGASVADISPVGGSGFSTVAIASGGGGAGAGRNGGYGGAASSSASAAGGDGSSGSGPGASPNPPGAGATGSSGGAGGGLGASGTSNNGGAGGSCCSNAGGGGGGAGRFGGGGGAPDPAFDPSIPRNQGGGGGGAGSSWVTTDSTFVNSVLPETTYSASSPQMSAIQWISFDTNSLSTGTVDSPYSMDIDATFGASTQATDFSITPTLPTGLSLNASTGVISGTPTVQVNSNFTITAATKDFSGKVQAQSFTSLNLTINAAPSPSPSPTSTPTPTPTPTLTVDVVPEPVHYGVVSRNGKCPAGWSVGGWEQWAGTKVCLLTSTYDVVGNRWIPGDYGTVMNQVLAWNTMPQTPRTVFGINSQLG